MVRANGASTMAVSVALLSSRLPQLRSGQNPTPSPSPIMLFTTAGLSLSNATRGANPACAHASSHTARNVRLPARQMKGSPSRSVLSLIHI